MRIAVIADIHGNLVAFDAALDYIQTLGVDQLVIAGDVVNGAPGSAECWQLVQSLNCPILLGNHERYVIDYGTERADPLWDTERFGPLHWTLDQLSDADRQEIAALPKTIQLPDFPNLLIVHASARNDIDTILGYTPTDELPGMFPDVSAKWIVRGHNHVCMSRFWEERVIITAGSIGLPLDGRTTAQFLVLDQVQDGWRVQHHAVPYDVDSAVTRFKESGYLDAAGPMARIYMREVATASYTLISFIQKYQSWEDRDEISLNDAVDRFLMMY